MTAAAVTGCGGAPLDTTTAPLSEGQEISPQRYLADSGAAAEAVKAFTDELAGLGGVARPARLRAAAPALARERDRARALAERLGAARLQDSRLDRQRAASAERLGRVLVAMDAVVRAADAGDSRAAVSAVDALRRAVDGLAGTGQSP